MISVAFPYEKQRRCVRGVEMAHAEMADGDPIVLLYGNPTSSYLRRNVLPYPEPMGPRIAPDLIGIGDSDKLPKVGPSSHCFAEHLGYLDALLEHRFSADGAKHHKPVREAYAYVENELGVEPAPLLLIDCHTWDTFGAVAAGWKASLVWRAANCLFEVDQPQMVGADLMVSAIS
jgi:pimeloyl-ACP methyl ester carboxylesterase